MLLRLTVGAYASPSLSSRVPQTSRVLERASVLLQTFEALDGQIPVVCVLLRQSSYDFVRAKEHLERLALKLPGAELDALQRLLQVLRPLPPPPRLSTPLRVRLVCRSL